MLFVALLLRSVTGQSVGQVSECVDVVCDAGLHCIAPYGVDDLEAFRCVRTVCSCPGASEGPRLTQASYQPVCAFGLDFSFLSACLAGCAGFDTREITNGYCGGACDNSNLCDASRICVDGNSDRSVAPHMVLASAPSATRHCVLQKCVCPDVLEPVCIVTTSGTAYELPNACAARCMGLSALEGSCSDMGFSIIPAPLEVGARGTVLSAPEFIQLVSAGPIAVQPADCSCSPIWSPVCATANGRTYGSLCLALCHGESKRDVVNGECRDACSARPCARGKICASKWGADPLEYRCIEPVCFCDDEEFAPVCVRSGDKDHYTAWNQCAAACSGFSSNDFTPGQCDELGCGQPAYHWCGTSQRCVPVTEICCDGDNAVFCPSTGDCQIVDDCPVGLVTPSESVSTVQPPQLGFDESLRAAVEGSQSVVWITIMALEQENQYSAEPLLSIRGCVKGFVLRVTTPEGCGPLQVGEQVIVAGRMTAQKPVLSLLAGSCPTAHSSVSPRDRHWLAAKQQVCGKVKSCVDETELFKCNAKAVCGLPAKFLQQCPAAFFCEVNNCGGCTAVFFDKSKEDVCDVEDRCPNGFSPVDCVADPCQEQTSRWLQQQGCAEWARAKHCLPSRCGHCHAKWTDTFGREVCGSLSPQQCVSPTLMAIKKRGKGCKQAGFGLLKGRCQAIKGCRLTEGPWPALFTSKSQCEVTCRCLDLGFTSMGTCAVPVSMGFAVLHGRCTEVSGCPEEVFESLSHALFTTFSSCETTCESKTTSLDQGQGEVGKGKGGKQGQPVEELQEDTLPVEEGDAEEEEARPEEGPVPTPLTIYLTSAPTVVLTQEQRDANARAKQEQEAALHEEAERMRVAVQLAEQRKAEQRRGTKMGVGGVAMSVVDTGDSGLVSGLPGDGGGGHSASGLNDQLCPSITCPVVPNCGDYPAECEAGLQCVLRPCSCLSRWVDPQTDIAPMCALRHRYPCVIAENCPPLSLLPCQDRPQARRIGAPAMECVTEDCTCRRSWRYAP